MVQSDQIIQAIAQQVNWSVLPELVNSVLQNAMTIQQIPAPTFTEGQRASHVAALFKSFDLQQVEIDERHNVYGLLPGKVTDVPGLMVSAHTDTVFPIETDLTIRQEADQIYGPGLGDNSMGVAGMLGLLELLRSQQITPECNIWFVANSCEEGLGDLDGMKMAFARLQARLKAVVNLEGLAFGHIYNSGIAVRRLKITAKTGGGHSWIHFGRASAIHAIMQLGSRITQIKPATSPRTTYNIGIIEGGQSINTIAASASLWLDMRSEEQGSLQKLEETIRKYIQESRSDEVEFEIEVVGDRPSGSIPSQHPLVQLALSALKHVGTQGTLETGSTDGNIPLAHNCPTVTIGVTQGGNAHRTDEFIRPEFIADGLKQLVILTLAATML